MTAERSQLELRAVEPVAQTLIRRLLVPDVYIGVELADGQHADLVLVDRAGTGDLHVVQVVSSLESASSTLSELLSTPVPYRWLAVSVSDDELSELTLARRAEFQPETGAGRVGLVRVVRMAADELGANVLWRAERFHGVRAGSFRDALASREPDMEFA